MYEVIKGFFDLQDAFKTKDGIEYHWYTPGDEYPREGYETNASRIAELSGEFNKMGTPLIKKVGEPEEAKEEAEEEKADLSSLTVKQLTELAAEKGVKLPAKARKSEIIELIEEK